MTKTFETPVKELKKIIEGPTKVYQAKTMEKSQSIKWKLTDYNEPADKLIQESEKKCTSIKQSDSQSMSFIKRAIFSSGKFTKLYYFFRINNKK